MLFAFLIALQSFSADTLNGKASKMSSFRGMSTTVNVLQSDLDDSPINSGAIFQTTILLKQFFHHACYLCEGTIENLGTKTLLGLEKVKLQV